MTVYKDLVSGFVTECTVTELKNSYLISPFTSHDDGTKTEYEMFPVGKKHEGYEYRLDIEGGTT